jgi:AraC-like DNA-binding protein
MDTTIREERVHGVRLTHAVASYEKRGRRRATSTEDVVRVHFSLRGRYAVRYAALGRSYDGLGPHYSVFYAHPFELDFVNETRAIETFGMAIPVADFAGYVDGASAGVRRFCDGILAGRPGFLYEPSAALPASMEHAVRLLLQCRYDGALASLYRFSQSLELLVRVLDAASPARSFPMSRSERDRVFAAREFVEARLTDPPSLRDVAAHAGLNEYKLKRGFRELFGTSVFVYLTEQRLELARKMLLDTEQTAAEIAYALGYRTPQHFSAAFKKRFGVSPKSMRKNP